MSNKKLKLTILSPERPVVQNIDADIVVLPAYGGEMGILPGHIKTVAQLVPGILHYVQNGARTEIGVMGGFAEVFKDEVSVFIEEAALAGEINVEEEKQKIAKAKASLSSRDADIDLELAEIELKASIMKMKLKNRAAKHP